MADYALIGDCHSAALVARDGSIDWWCAPRFDSPSALARLLDPAAGHFAVRPIEPYEVQREYVEDTMVLRTTFRTASGTLRLTDALALEHGARGHDIGLRSPHAIVRLAEALAGRVEIAVEFAPRPEYGLVVPVLERVEAGVRTRGGASALLLATGVQLDIEDATASAHPMLAEGERAAFAVHHGLPRSRFEPVDPARALEDTVAGWRSWVAGHEGYKGPYRDAVNRSALVLQALTYQPSGAIVAAPTTSLPEIPGGEANWDYRFAWLRDASLTLRALWVAACPHESQRLFNWMAAAVGLQRDRQVQIMFGVEGERDLSEHQLDHLAGYGGSRPVRVGNEAWRQRQLDVMGEVLEAAHILRDQLDPDDPLTTSFLCDLAERAAAGWRDTDAGIWEGREGERHYTSSKLMCWVALDRAVKLAPQLGPAARAEAWATARNEIRTAILEQAFDERGGVYAGAFGSDRLDASVLLMPIMGFLPAGDERMRATIDAVDRDLSHGGLVKRWSGAGEDEGAFVICSFWLANCLAQAGELDRAREVFEHVLGHANDVGLLAEEIDPRSGALLGNFPQAFSHVGLTTAAWSIDQATRRQEETA
ncbi:MAG: glycoside hydrolase family 15 protein [Thermoleophilaceae bacterium]|nr:glycoside hydrolase family 15 protein [Thermoleophilaceae bacterium]